MASTSSATKPFITRCLSLSKARSQFSSRCLSLSKAHYFYCIKIRVLYRTSLMFLWELKNAIISQNLRGLCDIKTNIKTTHSGFDKLNHLLFHYTVPEPVEGTFSLLISVPEPVEGRSYSSLWFRLRSITVLFITTLGAWACRRHILTSHLGAWACRRHIISIALKSVHSIEHLRCSFENSKTPLFHKISANFVI